MGILQPGWIRETIPARGGGVSVASELKGLFSMPYASVSAGQAAAMADGGTVIPDVREPHEWQAGRPGHVG